MRNRFLLLQHSANLHTGPSATPAADSHASEDKAPTPTHLQPPANITTASPSSPPPFTADEKGKGRARTPRAFEDDAAAARSVTAAYTAPTPPRSRSRSASSAIHPKRTDTPVSVRDSSASPLQHIGAPPPRFREKREIIELSSDEEEKRTGACASPCQPFSHAHHSNSYSRS